MAAAAKTTEQLIDGAVGKVKSGSDIVGRTNEAFTRVAEGAKKAGELVADIAAASNEQAQGIEPVSRAVVEMDNVTQQNAATAEESSSTAKEMNDQAERMKRFVDELICPVAGRRNGTVTRG